mmetsp:Transcript_31691/g.49603  ORF Transcript_31691/g.49603 Transcript_31691/m.49603 type:complete len:93 (-) Transcript_31691:88-366(-)
MLPSPDNPPLQGFGCEGASLVVEETLPDLLLCVHDEGPMLHNRFSDWLSETLRTATIQRSETVVTEPQRPWVAGEGVELGLEAAIPDLGCRV